LSGSIKGKIDRAYDEMNKAREELETKRKPMIEEGILEFCEKRLGFKPYSYQKKLLLDPAQFIVADGADRAANPTRSQQCSSTML